MSPQDLSGAHSRSAGPAARPKGAPMNAWLWSAAALAAGLLVYLVAALLRPEDFS